MKKMVQSAAALALIGAVLAPMPAAAQVAFNVGATTDYRYRGISQSRLDPALQGGVDYTAGAFYVGAWASTIKWIKDAGTINNFNAGNSQIELDLYGGYKGEISKDFTYDVGGLAYVYPGNKYAAGGAANANANTFELYGALTYAQFTAKYSHAVTNLFGNADSKNSYYLDLSATFDLGDGWGVVPHVGRQEIKGQASSYSYTDYSITGTKDFGGGLSASLGYVGTDADKTLYFTPAGKFTGKSALVAGIKYTF